MILVVSCETCSFGNDEYYRNSICKECGWNSFDKLFYVKEIGNKFFKKTRRFNYKNYKPNDEFIKEALKLNEFIKEEEFMI